MPVRAGWSFRARCESGLEEDCGLSLAFHWFLPTYGDSRNLVAGGHGTAMYGDRPATLRYLHQICAAAEDNGFEAVLTPTGLWCEDAWLTTAMLIEATETLKFLVAFRPGLLSPTLAAQMAGTFQRHSGGRLLLNVVTGGEPHEQRAYGDFLDKQARYARTAEFLHVVRQLWTSKEPVTFAGEHIQRRGCAAEQPARPDTRGVLRRIVGIGRAGGGQVLRRLPHLG